MVRNQPYTTVSYRIFWTYWIPVQLRQRRITGLARPLDIGYCTGIVPVVVPIAYEPTPNQTRIAEPRRQADQR